MYLYEISAMYKCKTIPNFWIIANSDKEAILQATLMLYEVIVAHEYDLGIDVSDNTSMHYFKTQLSLILSPSVFRPAF